MLTMDLYQLFMARSQGGLDVLTRNLMIVTPPSTTERYAHLSDDPVAEAAESISGAIKAAMDGQRGEMVELEDRTAK